MASSPPLRTLLPSQTTPEIATRARLNGDPYFESGRLGPHLIKDGFEAMPKTEEAQNMALGPVSKLGMNGEEAYNASQAAWGILWTVLALVGFGGIYNAAKGAGLI